MLDLDRAFKVVISIVPLVLVLDSWGSFIGSNEYKTYLSMVVITGIYLLVFWPKLLVEYKYGGGESVFVSWKWMLFLSIPFLVGVLSGSIGVLSGGVLAYRFGHEVAVHIVVLLWLYFMVLVLKNVNGAKLFMLFLGGAVLYVVYVGFFGINFFGMQGVIQKSTFGNKNLYSNYLISFLPLFLIFALPVHVDQRLRVHMSAWKLENSYYAIIFVLAMAGLFHAQTRSAIVGLIFSFLVFAAYKLIVWTADRFDLPTRVIALRLLFSSMIVAVLLYFLAYYLVVNYFPESRFLDLVHWHAWAPRLMPWEVALLSWLDAPWIGHGLGGSFNVFFEFLPSDSRLFTSARSYDHVHNEWLEVLQESGVVGLLAYLIFIWLLFRRVVKGLACPTLSPESRKLLLGAGLGVIAYLFHSTFSLATRMTLNEMGFVTLIAFIILALDGKGCQETDGKFCLGDVKTVVVGRQRIVRFFFPALMLLVGWQFFAGVAQGERDHYRFKTESISSAVDRRAQTQELSSTPNVELLHRLVVRQFKSGDLYYLEELMDKVEEKIPGFRDVLMQRAIYYQVSSGQEMDVGVFKGYIDRYLEVDRYYYPAMHWRARIAAWERDEERLIDQIEDLLRVVVISARVMTKWEEEQVRVELRDNIDGMLFQVSSQEAVLLLGRESFLGLMEDFRSINSRQEATKLMKEYANKVYLSIDPGSLSDYEKSRIENLLASFISRLSSWSKVPAV